MTRQLTAAAQTQAQSNAARPINIVKIEFGGSVGTKFYSDRPLGNADAGSALDAQARVIRWGRISAVLAEQTASAVGDCTLELADPDGTLKGYFDTVELQRKRVSVYQYFEELDEADLAPLLVGMIDAPIRWNRAKAVLRFDITDISSFHRVTIGHVAARDSLPLVSACDEDAVLPLAFGKVKRSETVCAQTGPTAVLVRACTSTDNRLFVDDASPFPQGQPIRIRIDNELIEGSFVGNTFHVTARGVDLVPSSHTTDQVDIHEIEDDTLTGEENEYVPYYIRIDDPGGTTHYRPIRYYSAGLHRLGYIHGIVYEGEYWTVPEGTEYAITSWARSHRAGSAIYYVQDRYVYILNDAPSKVVHRVEGYGRIFAEHLLDGDESNLLDIEGYVPIDPNLYTVNLNDTASFPDLGHAVTTLTLKCNPKELYPRLRDNRLWADLDGVEDVGDGSGALLENPAEIIRALLSRWVGLDAGETDAAFFDAASAALDGFQMAFTLSRQVDALHLCADLAFQARCALLWEDGTARLVVLRNRAGSPALTLGSGNVAENGIEIGRRDIRELASEVVARYRCARETRAVVLRDAAVEAAFGRRVRTLDLWAYADRRMAVSIARFWLSRWKYLFEEVRLGTFLPALKLQRNDTVQLDMAEHFSEAQKATVCQVIHQPGSGEPSRMDRVTLGLRLPVVAGCASTCETECESSGESGCLVTCEIEAESGCWQCETQCESLCELACTTEAELHCIVSDTGGGWPGGCGGCETSCEIGCETSCETDCEVACQVGCEVDCETGCEISCESVCEISCEAGQESSCQTGCEAACETGCETGCETDCETACEVLCETGCEMGCEVGCEVSCEEGCEVTCELGCEAIACETGCEVACEVGCEVTCELACEATACEIGCEMSCQVGCEASCEEGCEASACETDCETSCETDCETGCETGCESACQAACEIVCETECETCQEGPAPGENGCNGCNPAIPDTLYITFSDLDGDFAQYNGKIQVDHVSDCNWYNVGGPTTPYVKLFYDAVNDQWHIFIQINLFKKTNFVGPAPTTNPCAPWADSYTHMDGGASCFVSWS